MKVTGTWSKVWQIPLIIGFLSLIGLISALAGDDIWDVLSWMCLGTPVIIMGFYLIKLLKRSTSETSPERS